ncbi:ATP-grasp domain-containing protein [Gynuella sp.]|uniref:ATP-grasp domain-containing protein n=1 Tax=Gynuella sp. TaxID=2969146 RepID=UPI003D10976A
MKTSKLVLIEKYSFITTSVIAREAIKLGIDVVVIVPDTITDSQVAGMPFHIVRISDWSGIGLEQTIQKIEQDSHIIGIGSILGFFTGEGLLGAQVAELCQSRGLPHIPAEALFLANNKYLMRQTLAQNGIYTVRHTRVYDEESLLQAAQHVGFPLILKPVVGLGSSFISVCHNIDDMRRVFEHYMQNIADGYYAHFFCDHEFKGQYFDPQHEMLAEALIDGDEISVECLCTENEVWPLIVHDKLDVTQETYCSYENLLVTPPVQLNEQEQQQVMSYAQDILQALGLRNCFCHVEMRLDSQKRPSVIEVNPRIGGMRVKDSLKSLLALDYGQVFIDQLLGKEIKRPVPPQIDGIYGMAAIYPRNSGVLREVRGIEAAGKIPGMISITDHFKPGRKVGGNYEEVFVVDAWFHADTLDGILDIDKQMKSLVEVDIEY